MSRVIAELDKQIEYKLVHSGQNYDYELNEIFFEDLEIRKPDYFLGISRESVAQSIADIISKFDEVLELDKPYALLLYVDTNTCLAVIPAKRRSFEWHKSSAYRACETLFNSRRNFSRYDN